MSAAQTEKDSVPTKIHTKAVNASFRCSDPFQTLGRSKLMGQVYMLCHLLNAIGRSDQSSLMSWTPKYHDRAKPTAMAAHPIANDATATISMPAAPLPGASGVPLSWR